MHHKQVPVLTKTHYKQVSECGQNCIKNRTLYHQRCATNHFSTYLSVNASSIINKFHRCTSLTVVYISCGQKCLWQCTILKHNEVQPAVCLFGRASQLVDGSPASPIVSEVVVCVVVYPGQVLVDVGEHAGDFGAAGSRSERHNAAHHVPSEIKFGFTKTTTKCVLSQLNPVWEVDKNGEN